MDRDALKSMKRTVLGSLERLNRNLNSLKALELQQVETFNIFLQILLIRNLQFDKLAEKSNEKIKDLDLD